ncbi:uncharacterized protein LOC127278808 isoform X2 [Leptopilina boulardi]|uniref:uncharacterized protein LOC127278808 isoform X2 n=1 Tax=Leptopilina boulardi TaxID=63433 RepID=UPI0021F64448|nr:uncharacterized protein LOC127278808 isoform X2 [Leptopilina boulardi]
MSFFNTPLKHGKGVNKPFRSPLIKGDQNKQSTPLKLNQNPRIRSLGFNSPMNSRGFNSPMKPLLLTSPSKNSETETLTNCGDYSSPLKRIDNNLLLKRSRNNALKLLYDDTSIQTSENKLHIKSEKEASKESIEFITNVKNENQNSKEKIDSIINEDEQTENLELKKTPVSPTIQQAIDNSEYQPVVKLQRLNQNIINVYKQDFLLLIQRVNDKKREMVELRAKIPLERKISEDYDDYNNEMVL